MPMIFLGEPPAWTPEEQAARDRIEAARHAVRVAVSERDEKGLLDSCADYAHLEADWIRNNWEKRSFDTLHSEDVMGAAILSGRGGEFGDAVRSILVVNDDDRDSPPLTSLPEDRWGRGLAPLRAKFHLLDADWRPITDADGALTEVRGWLRQVFDRYQKVLIAFSNRDDEAAKKAINGVLRYERKQRPYHSSLLSLALYREAKRLGLRFTIRDLDSLKVEPSRQKQSGWGLGRTEIEASGAR